MWSGLYPHHRSTSPLSGTRRVHEYNRTREHLSSVPPTPSHVIRTHMHLFGHTGQVGASQRASHAAVRPQALFQARASAYASARRCSRPIGMLVCALARACHRRTAQRTRGRDGSSAECARRGRARALAHARTRVHTCLLPPPPQGRREVPPRDLYARPERVARCSGVACCPRGSQQRLPSRARRTTRLLVASSGGVAVREERVAVVVVGVARRAVQVAHDEGERGADGDP